MEHLGKKLAALVLALSVLFCAALCAAAEENILKLNESEIILAKGKTFQIDYEAVGAHDLGKPEKVTYATSDQKVASVASGKITAKGEGESTVPCTLTYKDGSALSADMKVRVYIPVSGVKLGSTKPITLNVNEKSPAIAFSVTPDNAKYQTVEAVATVDANGVITALKAGKTTVTAVSDDEASPKKASCQVTVLQPVTGLSLNQSAVELAKGKNIKLEAVAAPQDASNQKVEWESSDKTVAMVNANGLVTAKSKGTAVIYAHAKDGSGITAACQVEVFLPVTRVTLEKKTLTLNVTEKSSALDVSIAPEGAKYQAVGWSSDDEEVATVDANGIITAVKAGKAKITVASEESPSKSASLTVTVLQPVTGITVPDA